MAPTAPPSMLVTRTPQPSITALPTLTYFPSITSSPTVNSSNLSRLVQDYIADNSTDATFTNSSSTPATKITTTVTPTSRPSVWHTMPTTPSSTPVSVTTFVPTVSMLPTASSSPTASRFPSIAPTSMVQTATQNATKPTAAKPTSTTAKPTGAKPTGAKPTGAKPVAKPTKSTNKKNTTSTTSKTRGPTSPPTTTATTTPPTSTTTDNNNNSSTTSFGYSQSCPGFTSGGTGQVEKDVIFTYMVQTKLTQPLNSTSLLSELEHELLHHAANTTLSCHDLSPFHIYQLAYPTTTTTSTQSNSVSSFVPCQPTTTKTSSSAKSCWTLQTHMLVTTDEDTTDWAKYTVLAALQRELDQSSNTDLLKSLPQLVSTHYLGPNPQSVPSSTTAPVNTIATIPSSSSNSHHHHVLLPVTIILLVLAAVSSAFVVGFLVWIRQRRRTRLLEDPDSSSFLYSFKSSSTSRHRHRKHQQQQQQSSPSNTVDADLEMEMAEISDLLSRSKRRLEQHPPPRASFDSQDPVVSKTSGSSSTTSGTSHVGKSPASNSLSRSNSVKWKDSESLASYGPSLTHDTMSPTSSQYSKDLSMSSSSLRRHSQHKSIAAEVVQDNTRRRAERILEASASFHSRLSWTSSLDSDSVLLGTSPSDDTTVQETLARASNRSNHNHHTPNEQVLFYDDNNASPREDAVSALYTSSNTRDGLLRDHSSSHHNRSTTPPPSSRRTSDVKLPDLGRPTRGTRDVYHRVQHNSLL